MAFYETTFIANQELTAKQVDDLADNFVEFLKHADGKLVKKEYWGIRNFAYPIKKQKKGHYIQLSVDCSEDTIGKFEKKIATQEEVLKNAIFKVKEISKENSSLVKEE